MPNVKRPFIKMPYFFNLTEQKLKYLDILTYIALKSFDNPSAECFPSYQTVADKAGLSRDFTIKSISRLKEAGYIRIWRRAGFQSLNKSYSNHYYFNKLNAGDYFFMIPKEILNEQAITNYEKAILLLLYQFNATPNQLYGSIEEFADKLGLTKQAVYKKYLSLASKGFLDKSKLGKRNITTLLKINWDFTEYLFPKPSDASISLKIA